MLISGTWKDDAVPLSPDSAEEQKLAALVCEETPGSSGTASGLRKSGWPVTGGAGDPAPLSRCAWAMLILGTAMAELALLTKLRRDISCEESH
mmetsp:Transcript_57177/g.135965  ORF Transcript_57177/g.135965 Transcript_57177/m.135965 type:complete len:93 (+) Transcript_57177:407-685(+)